MIRVSLRGKCYGETPVLGALSFEVRAGETVALVGASGVGKSTLLRLITGIDEAFDGEISRPERQAVVFQEPTLLPWRSAMDNLLITHPDLTKDAARRAMEDVGLRGKETLFPGQLSLGQQRRLALARAFAGAPELLVMDEPFVSLDPETADTMLSLTEKLIAAHKPATLFVTHDRHEAERLADRILVLVAGAQGAQLAP